MRERVRRIPELPEFEPGFKLSPSLARYDKMEVSIDLGRLGFEKEDRIFKAFKRIGQKSLLLRQDGSQKSPKLITRARNAGEDWLYSATIKLSWSNRLRVYLKINPQRFFVHNPPDRIENGRPRGGSKDRLWLNRYGPAEIQARKQTLDGQDNFICSQRLVEAQELDWPEYILDYINLIRQSLEAEIHKCAPRGFLLANGAIQEWTIQSAEIGWEFHANNALLVAEDFGRHASSYFQKHRRIMHMNEIAREHAATYYIFRADKRDIEVAVYAKTEDRLRIECRFKGNPKTLYTEFDNEMFPRTILGGLGDMLWELRRKAAKEINPLKLAYKNYGGGGMLSRLETVQTLAALSHVTSGNQIITSHILKHLLTTGRVCERYNDPKYNQLLEDLKTRGLLKSMRKRPRLPREYAPHASFKRILDKFSGLN